jgi:hypothetical protein
LLGQQSQFGFQVPGLAGLVTQPIALSGIPLQGLSSAPPLFPQQPSHVM